MSQIMQPKDWWGIASITYLAIAFLALIPIMLRIFRHQDQSQLLPTTNLRFKAATKQQVEDFLMSGVRSDLADWYYWHSLYRIWQVYALVFTLVASGAIPLLALVSEENRWFIITVSSHASMIQVFNKGFNVESNYKLYDSAMLSLDYLHRDLQNSPAKYGVTEPEQIGNYKQAVDTLIRKVSSSRVIPSVDAIQIPKINP